MNNRYFIIGHQRSGTTLIHLLLKDHPNVSALNDELRASPFFSEGLSCFTHGNDYPEEKNLGYVRLFDTITTLMASSNTMANGAKCVCNSKKVAQILVEVISKHFQGMKIIHVVRNDLVAQYGSMLSSGKSGIMHSWYKGYSDQKINRVNINKHLFIAYILGCLDTDSAIGTLKKTNPYYRCNYEEYLGNPDIAKSNLFNFLQIPDLSVDWLASKKVLPSPERYINQYQAHSELMEKIKQQYTNSSLSMPTIFLAKLFSRVYYQFNKLRRIRAKRRHRQKRLLKNMR